MYKKRLLVFFLTGLIALLMWVQTLKPLTTRAWAWPRDGLLAPDIQYQVRVEILQRHFGPLRIEGLFMPIETGTAVHIGPAVDERGMPLENLKMRKGKILTIAIPIKAEEHTKLDHLALRYRFWGFRREIKIPEW